ncbi:hypothetical protein ACEWY4_013512 [Coilia grayii]|uniref:HAT C-terminal dimerisation domain-containing protein n=1 Tax=Coilia grayii TaxID=363190 RepID=A0ABD1JWL4_9TELE
MFDTVSWKREFYEAVDLVSEELQRRFSQETLMLAVKRERAVIAAEQGGTVELGGLQLPTSVDSCRLDLQLKMLNSVTSEHPCATVRYVAERLCHLHPQTRTLFTEVEKLIQLCLCLPISVASSERSFSTLRRQKTWLRSTMTQKRLTHLSLMNVHKDIMYAMDMNVLMRDFISMTPERLFLECCRSSPHLL